MTVPEHNMRAFSTESPDFLIEAYVTESGNTGKFHTIIFKAGEISYLTDINENISAIVLKNNIYIPIKMPLQQLKQKIYQPDFKSGATIDLKDVSGKCMKDALIPTLSNKFNTPLLIHAILRKRKADDTTLFSFLEDDVLSWQSCSAKSRSGEGVTITFNEQARKGPFGEVAILDMPHSDLKSYLYDTKVQGDGVLDLCQIFKENPKKYGFKPQ